MLEAATLKSRTSKSFEMPRAISSLVHVVAYPQMASERSLLVIIVRLGGTSTASTHLWPVHQDATRTATNRITAGSVPTIPTK